VVIFVDALGVHAGVDLERVSCRERQQERKRRPLRRRGGYASLRRYAVRTLPMPRTGRSPIPSS